jgi:hypothetical protein
MLLIALVGLLATKLLAAEDLLVIPLYARVTPAGQVEPTPDAVIESILCGDLRHARRKVLSNHPISTKPPGLSSPVLQRWNHHQLHLREGQAGLPQRGRPSFFQHSY